MTDARFFSLRVPMILGLVSTPFLLATSNTGSCVKNRQALFKFSEYFLLLPKKHETIAWNYFQ